MAWAIAVAQFPGEAPARSATRSPRSLALGCPGTPGGDAGTLAAIQRVKITVTGHSKNPDADFGGQLISTMTSNVDLRNIGLPP